MKAPLFGASCALLTALALSGCGGGGSSATPSAGVGNSGNGAPLGSVPVAGSSTPAPAAAIPPASSLNQVTSYTVYTGTAGTQPVVAVVPFGAGTPSGLANAAPAPGAYVAYPDGSVQVADVLGNFDAAQSSWAQANASGLLANANLNPAVTVAVPASATPAQPVEATVLASASGQSATAATPGTPATLSANADLTTIHVLPRNVALFDNERRTFVAFGVDTNGNPIGLSGANVRWSVDVPVGCSNAPGGTIAVNASDASKATYAPPATGSFPQGCQDIVRARIAATAGTLSGAGSAYYYDVATAVQLSGTVADRSGHAVPTGVISFTSSTGGFGAGDLLGAINGGAYARLVPANATLTAIAGNIARTATPAIAYFALTPSSVASGAGATRQTQNFAETAQPAQNPLKALPPISRAIVDGAVVKHLADARPPFGVPNASGAFPAGSAEAILASPTPNASGTLTSGLLSGWLYKWDSTGKIAVFAEPSSELGGRSVMQVTAGATTFNGAACPASHACFSYTLWYNAAGLNLPSNPSALTSPIASLPAGTVLDTDGAFAQPAGAPNPYQIQWLQNDYSAGHQTQGHPLYTHVLVYSATPGSQSASLTDNWTNADGKPAGSVTAQRIASTQSGVLYTYSGTATRTYYASAGSTGTTTQVTYGFNGTMLAGCAGTFASTLTASPNATDTGTVVNWIVNSDAQESATGLQATGNVQNPNVTGLTHPPTVATFTEDENGFVTVTTDPSLGSTPGTFHI